MSELLRLLKKPTFTSLKVLVPPHRIQTRKNAFDEIAKCCPMLEDIDAGENILSRMKIDDLTLLSLPQLFPHLKCIGFNMHKVTNTGVSSFCRNMAHRLRSLSIYDSYYCDAKLTDKTLKTISEHCPNLEMFMFHFASTKSSKNKSFGENGIIDLVKGCSNLKILCLHMTHTKTSVGTAAFEYIADNDCSLDTLEVVGDPALQSNKKLRAKLTAKLRSFKVISSSYYNTVSGHYEPRPKGSTDIRSFFVRATDTRAAQT